MTSPQDKGAAGHQPIAPSQELSPQQALKELRRRGRDLDEAEREYLMRRLLQAVHPERLAERLLSRVPGLRLAAPDDDRAEEDDPCDPCGALGRQIAEDRG